MLMVCVLGLAWRLMQLLPCALLLLPANMRPWKYVFCCWLLSSSHRAAL
jgi:hypothetical protein